MSCLSVCVCVCVCVRGMCLCVCVCVCVCVCGLLASFLSFKEGEMSCINKVAYTYLYMFLNTHICIHL